MLSLFSTPSYYSDSVRSSKGVGTCLGPSFLMVFKNGFDLATKETMMNQLSHCNGCVMAFCWRAHGANVYDGCLVPTAMLLLCRVLVMDILSQS